ncbi:hypothetical protein DFA_02903 [Cavenderia fasciculata]|uniref:ComC supersandwich domain-containing protein n=1 Tax=Cavenderia fasciculata TaxID=261658 RepID=F4PIT0_CACFS|nr:uncharacterized protein DFA_02903 [Cavenderia fasciculata]EGG24659.1 hypothetical protein DFA_02903 [Cavenderia fasciculata]|eukprot:XP_004362510.1 hypothetical protein DFA_02903 [Cavenderia fasciculata]
MVLSKNLILVTDDALGLSTDFWMISLEGVSIYVLKLTADRHYYNNELLFQCKPAVSQLQLPTLEFESAVWIIRQYGLTIPQQQASICGSIFICFDYPDGFKHILNIDIDHSTFTDVGAPDTNLLSLYLPQLNTLILKADDVADPTLNIMDRIKSLKTTTTMDLGDTSINSLPADFTDFPSLQVFTCKCSLVTTIPKNFLNNSAYLQHFTFDSAGVGLLTSVTVDDTLYFPRLNYYTIIYSKLDPASHLFNITSKSFPSLESLTDILSAVQCTGSGGSQCHLTVSHPEVVSYIGVSGPQSSITPPVGPTYVNLETAVLEYMQYTSFPFTVYPPKLRELNLRQNQITAVPNAVVPSTLKILILGYNQLTGSAIPDGIFANNNGLDIFDLQNNPTFTGPITTDYCKHEMNIINTNVQDIPDCFWCYINSPGIMQTNLNIPGGFTCNDYYIDNSTMIVTNNSIVEITGFKIGWGNYYQNGQCQVDKVVANSKLKLTFDNPVSNTLSPFTVVLASFSSAPQVQLSIIEGGITIGQVSYQPLPPLVVVNVEMIKYNPYFDHTLTIDGSITCAVGPNDTAANCPPLERGVRTVTISNGHYSASATFNFEMEYPIVNKVTPVPALQGSLITLTGNYGLTFSTPSVSFMEGTVEIAQCAIQSINSTTIVCQAGAPIYDKQVELLVLVDGGFSTTYIITGMELCQLTTKNCSGNGQCDAIQGVCICTSNAFYNNCSKRISGSYDSTNTKIVTLEGDFGPFGQVNPIIKINNTLQCTVAAKSQFKINCTLDQSPTFGLSSVQLQVDTLNTTARNILVLRPLPNNGGGTTTTTTTTTATASTTSGGPSLTPKQQCEKDTFNCYGHGYCDENGICQCESNYNPVDNCFTKFINTTIKPNTTDPTVSFDIDGIDFQFEIVSIQELDLDAVVLKELFISNYSWNVNVSSNNIITIVNYQLNTTTNSSSSPPSSFQSVLVSSTISFSTQSRDIQFGDQTLHINPNSIKLAVNITNWQYSSNLATLRVVFRTIIVNNQSIEYGCDDEKEVDPFAYDSLSSLQYLRVIKDDVQFNGRFIDFALSDGRPTYSQTQLISLTQLNGGEQSIAMIGVGLPQCHECVLDPDFTPLLIDKSECSESQSDTWKIIVGVVVGGVTLVAIIIAAVMGYKKAMKIRKHNEHISRRLKRMNMEVDS